MKLRIYLVQKLNCVEILESLDFKYSNFIES